eukprot:569731_1
MAAYVFMKEVLGINVTFYPTTSYDDIWNGEHWDNFQSDAYPRNYFEWLANDDMDLNFEVWSTQLSWHGQFDGHSEYVTPGHIELGENGASAVEGVFVPKYLYDQYPRITSISEIQSNSTLRQLLIDGPSSGTTDYIGTWLTYNTYGNATQFDTPNYAIPTIWGSHPTYLMSQYFNDLIQNVPTNDGMNVAFSTVGSERLLTELVTDLYEQRLPFLANMYTVDDNFGHFDQISGELLEFVELEFPDNPTNSQTDGCYVHAECESPTSTIYKTANPRLSQKSPFALSFFEAFEMDENQVNLLVAYYWNSTVADSTERWLDATCKWLYDSDAFSTWNAWNTSVDWSLKGIYNDYDDYGDNYGDNYGDDNVDNNATNTEDTDTDADTGDIDQDTAPNQSILDDFQCFDEPASIPSDYPAVAVMM